MHTSRLPRSFKSSRPPVRSTGRQRATPDEVLMERFAVCGPVVPDSMARSARRRLSAANGNLDAGTRRGPHKNQMDSVMVEGAQKRAGGGSERLSRRPRLWNSANCSWRVWEYMVELFGVSGPIAVTDKYVLIVQGQVALTPRDGGAWCLRC